MTDLIYDESGFAVGAATKVSDDERLCEIADAMQRHSAEHKYPALIPAHVGDLRRIAEKLRWRPSNEHKPGVKALVRWPNRFTDGPTYFYSVGVIVLNHEQWRPLDD